ncbi:SDR family oxidoreductase [Olleya marilimosa]|uniref:SDR family oxidoreductase n=1 Tax=Olleya marilimosa TaxID=272164 RepID=A0ABR8LPR7_9FLAO|nr:SDR family oxidoreductase [Olleya marilimosa]MBD3862206.1 SDR family oxidoreductase [Olleya marilimosa]MBD3889701.1 SDR family oxidoreductase [Olleya marilimosa]
MSKVVLITGGSSGIGKSIGEFLTQKGFIVYGTSRNPSNYTNSKFKLVALDVNDTVTIADAVRTVIEAEGKLDVLVNNAGVGINGPIEEIPQEQIQHNFNTNFFGPINVIKAVLPQMRAQQSGLVINITSIAGYMGLPYRGIYSASKGALELVTEALRMETKDFGVKFTNIAPGDFATNIAAGRYHAPVLKDSPYTKYPSVLKDIDDHVDNSSSPIAVAKKVHQVINTKNPKIHYKVGAPMQKFSIVLKFLLPDTMYEKLLLNHYKL